MPKPEQAFSILYNRAPTDADKLRLMRVKDALGLRDNDDLWAVFIALGHFQALYEDIPNQIVEKTNEICGTISTAAEKATIARLSESVVNQVNAIAGKRAIRDVAVAIIIAVCVSVGACVAIAGTAFWIYQQRVAEKEAEIRADAQRVIASRVGEDAALISAIRTASGITGSIPYDYGERLVLAASLTPERFDWIKSHVDVIDWVRSSDIDALSKSERSRVAAIIKEATVWRKIGIDNNAAWPCVREYQNTDKYKLNGVVASMCEVGIGNIK